MRRWTVALSGLGCFGIGGAVLAGGGLVVGGVGLVLVYQALARWEEAVRMVLDPLTGGEVTFEGLSPGWGTVRVNGVVVTASDGQPFAEIDVVEVGATDLAAFASEHWTLSFAEARGVRVNLRRDADGWAWPEQTLALLRGQREVGVSTPDVAIPLFGAADVDAAITLPGGEVVHATARRAELTQVLASLGTGVNAKFDTVYLFDAGVRTASGQQVALKSAVATAGAPVDAALDLSLTNLAASGITVSSPQGLRAAVDELAAPTLVIADEGTVAPIAATFSGVSASATESVRVKSGSAQIGAISLASEALLLDALALDGLSAEVPAAGWTLPGAFAKAAGADAKIAWWPVKVADVNVSAVQARSGEARAAVQRVSLWTLGLDARSASWSGIRAEGASLSDAAGTVLASASVTTVGPQTWNLREGARLGLVTLTGPVATVRKGAPDLGLPPGTFSLATLSGAGAPGLTVGTARGSSAQVTVLGAKGERLDASVGSFDAAELRFDGGWRLGSATAASIAANDGGRPVARVDRATLGSDGRLSASGAEVWLAVREDRRLLVPPIAKDHVPSWMGGDLRDLASWWGIDLTQLPWVPKEVLANAAVHLDDPVIGKTKWEIAVSEARVSGPSGTRAPLSVKGTMAGGTFAVVGHATPDGELVLDLGAEGMDAAAFDPYLQAVMSKAGLSLTQGKGGAKLKIVLDGSVLDVSGKVNTVNVAVTPIDNGKVVGAALAVAADTLTRGRITLPDTNLPVAFRGDMADPGFSFVDELAGSVARELVKLGKGGVSSTVRSGASFVGGEARDVVGIPPRGEGSTGADRGGLPDIKGVPDLNNVKQSLGIGKRK